MEPCVKGSIYCKKPPRLPPPQSEIYRDLYPKSVQFILKYIRIYIAVCPRAGLDHDIRSLVNQMVFVDDVVEMLVQLCWTDLVVRFTWYARSSCGTTSYERKPTMEGPPQGGSPGMHRYRDANASGTPHWGINDSIRTGIALGVLESIKSNTNNSNYYELVWDCRSLEGFRVYHDFKYRRLPWNVRLRSWRGNWCGPAIPNMPRRHNCRFGDRESWKIIENIFFHQGSQGTHFQELHNV